MRLDLEELGDLKGIALHLKDDQKHNVQHRCSTAGLDLLVLSSSSTNTGLREP